MSDVDKKPCTYCMMNKPEHNPIMAEMDKIALKKDKPPKISNKKMFESVKKVPKGSHKMPDGSIMKDSEMKKGKKKKGK